MSSEEFDKIARNAQNAINSVEVLMEIIKKTGDVAKLFLMLSNPAGTIIVSLSNYIHILPKYTIINVIINKPIKPAEIEQALKIVRDSLKKKISISVLQTVVR